MCSPKFVGSTLLQVAVVYAALRADAFVHPGVLFDAAQLDFITTQAAAGSEPFNSTLKTALKKTWVNNHTTPAGPPNASSPYGAGVIACGYYDSPDWGCNAESTDATAALLQAYLWAVTREPAWALKSAALMDHYATAMRGYLNWENGPLEAAWAAQKWARAAEILNSTGSPWPAAAAAAFGNMLQRYSVPMLWNGSCANGNWELSMIEGLSSIAVFTNNVTLWDRALAMWRVRVPAYVYYEPFDGPHPAPGPASCGGTWWFNQVVFNASVNGVAQETCRDFGHTAFGIASLFNVAETARIQGVDLYAEQAPRLTATLEFHTALLNAGGYPPTVNVTSPLVCNGTVLKLSTFPTYQVGLTGLSRLYPGYNASAALPETTTFVQGAVWPGSARYDGCTQFMSMYEPLTHGRAVPPS